MDSLHAKRTVLDEDEGVDNQENNTDDDAAAVDDEDEMW